MPKVVFCVPFLEKPTKPFIESLEKCLPAVEAAGWTHEYVQEVGNPYISRARADMVRKALDAKADVLMLLDYDVSWEPQDMVKILSVDAPVVAGLYRYKDSEERYMGIFDTPVPIVRQDGCILANKVPAGFLKITAKAVSRFATAYPELLFGDPMHPTLDLFNHGAIDGVWYGEDYAFSKRWVDKGMELLVCPDLNLGHHSGNDAFYGNFHRYLIKTTGG